MARRVYVYSASNATEREGEHEGRRCTAVDFASSQHGCPAKGSCRIPQTLETYAWVCGTPDADQNRIACIVLNRAKRLITEAAESHRSASGGCTMTDKCQTQLRPESFRVTVSNKHKPFTSADNRPQLMVVIECDEYDSRYCDSMCDRCKNLHCANIQSRWIENCVLKQALNEARERVGDDLIRNAQFATASCSPTATFIRSGAVGWISLSALPVCGIVACSTTEGTRDLPLVSTFTRLPDCVDPPPLRVGYVDLEVALADDEKIESMKKDAYHADTRRSDKLVRPEHCCWTAIVTNGADTTICPATGQVTSTGSVIEMHTGFSDSHVPSEVHQSNAGEVPGLCEVEGKRTVHGWPTREAAVAALRKTIKDCHVVVAADLPLLAKLCFDGAIGSYAEAEGKPRPKRNPIVPGFLMFDLTETYSALFNDQRTLGLCSGLKLSISPPIGVRGYLSVPRENDSVSFANDLDRHVWHDCNTDPHQYPDTGKGGCSEKRAMACMQLQLRRKMITSVLTLQEETFVPAQIIALWPKTNLDQVRGLIEKTALERGFVPKRDPSGRYVARSDEEHKSVRGGIIRALLPGKKRAREDSSEEGTAQPDTVELLRGVEFDLSSCYPSCTILSNICITTEVAGAASNANYATECPDARMSPDYEAGVDCLPFVLGSTGRFYLNAAHRQGILPAIASTLTEKRSALQASAAVASSEGNGGLASQVEARASVVKVLNCAVSGAMCHLDKPTQDSVLSAGRHGIGMVGNWLHAHAGTCAQCGQTVYTDSDGRVEHLTPGCDGTTAPEPKRLTSVATDAVQFQLEALDGDGSLSSLLRTAEWLRDKAQATLPHPLSLKCDVYACMLRLRDGTVFGIPADPEQMVQHSKWLCKHKLLNGAKGSADEVELTRAGFAHLCWQRMQGKIPTGGLKEAILERMRVVLCEWCPHVQRREKLVTKVKENLQKGIDVSQHVDAIMSAMARVVFG